MKGSSTKFSYGMRRAEVLSAIASISFLVVLTLYLVVEAFVRIHLWTKGEMEAVDGKIMTIIAGEFGPGLQSVDWYRGGFLGCC